MRLLDVKESLVVSVLDLDSLCFTMQVKRILFLFKISSFLFSLSSNFVPRRKIGANRFLGNGLSQNFNGAAQICL